MNRRTATALALSVIAVAAFLLEVISWHATGSIGGRLRLSGLCTAQFVTTSQEERQSRIHPGDVVDLRKANWLFRADTLPQIVTPTVFSGAIGDTVSIPIARGSRQIRATETLQQRGSFAWFIANVGFKLFFLLLGAFVLFRGRDPASLVLGVWCIVIALALPEAWFGLGPPTGRVGLAMTAAVFFSTAPVLLYFIIEAVVRGLMPPSIVWLTRGALFICAAPALYNQTVNTIAQVGSGCGLLVIRSDLGLIANQVIIFLFFVVAYGRAQGLQRQRIRWVFWAFLISRIGIVMHWLNPVVAHPVQYGVEWLTVMCFPLGTAYAVLRHHIIDVSFALNRALLYTVVTTLTVSALVLLENVLNNFAVNRGIGLAVSVFVALSIGISLHVVRERLHSWINQLLFRRKHKTAVALNRFIDEAPFIQNQRSLVARASEEIRINMATDDVRFYQTFRDGYHRVSEETKGGREDLVDADDPAFLRLRSTLTYVDLSEVPTALGPAGYAFPLVARGESFGALVCGRRTDDEGYAPDERDLLRHVAREVAAELFMMRLREEDERREDADARRIRELEDENRRLKEALEPDQRDAGA